MVDVPTLKLTDQQIDAAQARGRRADQQEPRAARARFDKRTGHISLVLTNGCTFAFPPHLAQGLETAADDELANMEILGNGYGLHWPALDVDLSVPSLLSGILGTRAFMARQAGRVSSPAKALAARANGMKGGRPRKVSVT